MYLSDHNQQHAESDDHMQRVADSNRRSLRFVVVIAANNATYTVHNS